MFSGSFQFTSRLLLDFAVARTVIRPGTPGASGTSSISIFTAFASLPPCSVEGRRPSRSRRIRLY